MKSNRNRWIRGVGAVVLVGGLIITGWGLGVTSAASPASNPGNPFQAILDKLDQILAATTGAAGQGNPTLRWDTNHPSATRFTTAFTGAVLDKNTGLVWEQAPNPISSNWYDAISYCVNKNVGGTRGWRLPSVPELASLLDTSLPAPFVPASVFTGVTLDWHWSSTSTSNGLAQAWYVDFFDSEISSQFKGKTTSTVANAWCVRGDMNADQY